MNIIEISSGDEDVQKIPPKASTIDEDEVQITHIKTIQKPQEDVQYIGAQDLVICYGMFRAPIHLFQETGTTLIFVKVNMEPRQDQPHHAITFSFDNEPERIAEMVDGFAKFLYPLAVGRVCQFEAYLDITNPVYPMAKLLLYGFARSGNVIASHFVHHRVALEHPDIQPKRAYINPTMQPVQDQSSSNQNQIYDQTKKQIEELYKSFTSPEYLEEMVQDDRLTSTLFKYQRQALHWMFHREQISDGPEVLFWNYDGRSWTNILTDTRLKKKPKQTRGGILADDMGLGKTIQIISLILKAQPKYDTIPIVEVEQQKDPFGFIPPSNSAKKPVEHPDIGKIPSRSTLIICPLSLIHNWEDQIYSHTKKDALSVLVHHGPGRNTDPEEIAKYDVVITTYNVIGHRFGRSNEISPLHKVYWHRIVLDEAHIIKSPATLQAKSVFAFKAEVKWCLTGTPVQNKLDDLFSLVRFIEIQPLDRKADWCTFITRPISQQKSQNAFRRLQTLMKGITLRRVKTDLIDGKPILQLPPRTEQIVTLDLYPAERETYDRIHQAGRHVFESLKAQGHVLSQFAMILKAILMMRQACLHPELAKWDEKEFLADFALPDLSVKLSPEQVKTMFQLLRQTEEDTCIFCNTTVEGSGVCMSPCKHLICSNCRDLNFPKKQNSFSDAECPLCKTKISGRLLADVPEDVMEKADEMENNLNLATVKEDSTKIDALLKDLQYIKAQDLSTGEVTKSVVFSQFTTLLTLIQEPLRKAGIKFVRMDGSMTRIQRSNALNEFKNNPDTRIFLLSIKAGGVGLNLVTASRVYLMEPYWNPAVEQQAIDRVHRLGQTKPVTTVRFIIKNSIEENMQKRQKYKIALAQKAFNEDGDDEDEITDKRKRKRNPKNKEAILLQKLESISILFQ